MTTDWRQRCLELLPEHLDERGDLAPPWEQFPSYERYTIGWRMGAGESWLSMWHVFLERIEPVFEARLAYLRRHAVAPISWASAVYSVLYPSARDEDEEREGEEEEGGDADGGGGALQRREELLRLGLIASDVAYSTWLRQQQGVRWPWTYSESPENAARYWTRDLAFWSRQVAALRGDPAFAIPEVPRAWEACAAPLRTGDAGRLDLGQGLLSLARVLAAGHVAAPWQLGLTPDDFADSFDDDMGYADAFRLWGMSVFDDRAHLERYLAATAVPAAWRGWVAEHLHAD